MDITMQLKNLETDLEENQIGKLRLSLSSKFLNRACQNSAFLHYRISSVIRWSFFFFQNNPKDLDPSRKMDLDLWVCLGRVKLVL